MFLLDSLEALYKHMTLIKLYFSRDRKLYLMEMPMIKPEEPKWLNLVVYRVYLRELTDCCLPSRILVICLTKILCVLIGIASLIYFCEFTQCIVWCKIASIKSSDWLPMYLLHWKIFHKIFDFMVQQCCFKLATLLQRCWNRVFVTMRIYRRKLFFFF